MKIVNLTPHSINIMNEEKEIVTTISPSGKVARLETIKELIRVADGIPFYSTKYGIPICLKDGEEVQFPEIKTNTILVVSSLFRASFDRFDLWQPGELVRDENVENYGQPIGCIGLSQ